MEINHQVESGLRLSYHHIASTLIPQTTLAVAPRCYNRSLVQNPGDRAGNESCWDQEANPLVVLIPRQDFDRIKVLAFVLDFKNEYHRLQACLRQASAQSTGKLTETSGWGKVEIVHLELVNRESNSTNGYSPHPFWGKSSRFLPRVVCLQFATHWIAIARTQPSKTFRYFV